MLSARGIKAVLLSVAAATASVASVGAPISGHADTTQTECQTVQGPLPGADIQAIQVPFQPLIAYQPGAPSSGHAGQQGRCDGPGRRGQCGMSQLPHALRSAGPGRRPG